MLKAVIGANYERYDPSVLLTTFFNAFEFDFVSFLDYELRQYGIVGSTSVTDRNLVLQLPAVDVGSPVAWSNLAHEFGHAVDRELKLSVDATNKARAAERILTEDITRTMCEELAADLIAARVLGPAPMMALLSFSYCTLARDSVEWKLQLPRVYPPVRWRARAVLDYLDKSERSLLSEEAEAFDRAWEWRVAAEHGDTARDEFIFSVDRAIKKTMTLLSKYLTDEINKLDIPRFAFGDVDLQRLTRRLADRLPVGAQGRSRPELTALLNEYANADATNPRTRREYEDLRGQFDEGPTPMAAILLSGAMHRLDVIKTASLELADFSTELLDRVTANLDETDSLLRTSIDSRAVLERARKSMKSKELSAKALAAPMPTVDDAEGALLSDIQILRRLVEEKPDRNLFVSPVVNIASQLGPSSLDVRLGTDVQITTIAALSEINLGGSRREIAAQKREYLRPVRIGPGDSFVLHPGEFMLATTVEYFRFPRDLAGRLEGRSSLGRLGLQVHATAGFVDPGFRGSLTFELINSGNLPIRIPPGFRLAQLCFFPVGSVQVPYEGKYVGSIGVEPSRIEEDAEIR